MSHEIDVEIASEAIVQLEFPSFGEMLDMTIRHRVGNLIWEHELLINQGRRTVKQALIGTQAGHFTHLLSFSEMRDMRLRNRMNQIMNDNNARETLNSVRQSLERLGYARLFSAIGVDVAIKKDRDKHPHIVFIEASPR